MTATALRTPSRLLLGLAPCVCLPLLLLYPSTAEPTPSTAVISTAAVTMPPPSIEAFELPVPAADPVPAQPEAVHVVLTRGHKRFELDLPMDGNLPADTAKELARFMRCRVSGRTHRIATGALALLADVAARYPGHEIEVVSAVRAEPDRTRAGIKHSRHWDGHAIDLIVRGVKLSEVRDVMWKTHTHIGVGWYPSSGFIHLDYRPDVNDTAWTQPHRNADNNYHPRWARIARDTTRETSARRAEPRVASRSE